MHLQLSQTNLVLLVVGLVLVALNAVASSRLAPVIAGFFAHLASRHPVRRHG